MFYERCFAQFTSVPIYKTRMMRDTGVTPLGELRHTAIDLGAKLPACKMSMDVMEITKDDLIDEVEDVVVVATYIKHAAESQVTLFI